MGLWHLSVEPGARPRRPRPSPGQWAGLKPYYRIELAGYEPFTRPLPVRTLAEAYGDRIRREIVEEAPRYYPFATYGPGIRTAQGLYLARATPNLRRILAEALAIEAAAGVEPGTGAAPARPAHAEGVRRSREAYFFARHPGLVEAAKRYYGYRCLVCQFDFAARYGELGRGYIECHHLNSLAERPEREWTEGVRTRLDEVAVLCANCHRMVHRRRPALSLAELRAIYGHQDVQR